MTRRGLAGQVAPFSFVLLAFVPSARAAAPPEETDLPPWTERGDVPLPGTVRSIVPKRDDVPIYREPGKPDVRRGSVQFGARLPLFGARRDAGCRGRFFLVGPHAWLCSDDAEPSEELPLQLPLAPVAGGLPYRYYVAGKDGAYGFRDIAHALADDAPDQELETGFIVGTEEERSQRGETFVRSHHGMWLSLREVSPLAPLAFRGVMLSESERLDFAWVVADKAPLYDKPTLGKASSFAARRQVVKLLDDLKGPLRKVQTERGERWMRASDLAEPRLGAPPAEALKDGAAARWIDVDLSTQTLVAYEGPRPVYAALVSTGKGPKGSDTATRPGVFRIWVKLVSTNMDNLENADAERHYSIEDVPWVQFFDKGIALHGAFWHQDFGRVHSHGCVNLSPLDAEWLFRFTSPLLPRSWSAVLPTPTESGTVVRVTATHVQGAPSSPSLPIPKPPQ